MKYYASPVRYIYALSLGFLLCHSAYGGAPLACSRKAIESIIPAGWKIHSTRSNVLPEGHYWANAERYKGKKGVAVLAIGPTTVHFEWQAKSGIWSRDALGKESLELYFMPAAYSEDRIRSPKRPRSANLIFEGVGCRVYGLVSFKIVEKRRFNELLKIAAATHWVDVPTADHDLSWPNWRLQVRQAMASDISTK